jgi:hypothetical protein
VVPLADAKDAAEGHHRIRDLARPLVEHDIIDLAQMLAIGVVDVGPGHLAGGDDTGVLIKLFHAELLKVSASKRFDNQEGF